MKRPVIIPMSFRVLLIAFFFLAPRLFAADESDELHSTVRYSVGLSCQFFDRKHEEDLTELDRLFPVGTERGKIVAWFTDAKRSRDGCSPTIDISDPGCVSVEYRMWFTKKVRGVMFLFVFGPDGRLTEMNYGESVVSGSMDEAELKQYLKQKYGKQQANPESCVRPERNGAVNTTLGEQARGGPETKDRPPEN